MYADNDNNEIDKMADTEEKRAFDARFLQECKEYEQENEADTMDDTETEDEREASFEKEIHPNEGTAQEGNVWGRPRPRFHELSPNNNAEEPRGAQQEDTEEDDDEEITKSNITNMSNTKVKYPENQREEEAGKSGEETE